MTSPKDALEKARDCLQTYGPSTKDDALWNETVHHVIQAAIPVAELHQEAVGLLKQHENLPNLVTDDSKLGRYLKWLDDRNNLLAKIKALK